MADGNSQTRSPAIRGADGLRVSGPDRVAGGIVSLLIVIGFLVALMAAIVFTQRVISSRRTVGAELLEEAAGRGDNPVGYEEDFREPGLDELQELTPNTETLLSAVTDVISAKAANPDVLDGAVSLQQQGRGDRRQAGPVSGGTNVVPRWERWEIKYAAESLTEYAKQLDFFRIELGAIGGGRDTIDYVSKLSAPQAAVRHGKSEAEERLYMTWTAGQLQKADRTLLARARVPARNRVVVQFYPADVENRLATLERDKAGTRPLEEIYRTIFDVQAKGNGYAFRVVEQIYR